MSIFCKHYNGIPSKVCELSISYDQVRDPDGSLGHRHPCYDPSLSHLCTKAEYPTPEEVAEQDREIAEMLKAFLTKIDNNTCPHCDQPMTKKQIGRCVYAQPCGHRLYQGKV